jgi:hypothetical protein
MAWRATEAFSAPDFPGRFADETKPAFLKKLLARFISAFTEA